MRSPLILSTVLALSTLAGAGLAQSLLFDGVRFSAPWAAPASDGTTFGSAFAADLFGDGAPDALMFDGGALYGLIDADHTYAPLEIASAAIDACVLPRAGSGARDLLAVVDAVGLHLVEFDPQTAAAQWSFVPLPAWAGARSVRAVDLDGDGLRDLFGIGADGNSVLCALAGTGTTHFPSVVTLTTPAPVTEVVALQWNLDVPLEFALHCSTGVFVVDLNGALLNHFATSKPGVTLTRVASASSAFDRLAWVRPHATGNGQWLSTLSQFGVDAQIDLGELGVVAAVAADADADGDDDLLLSHCLNYQLLWLCNRRSTSAPGIESFQLSPSSVRLIAAGPLDRSAEDNRAAPALADFDGDGDFDVVFGCESSQTVEWIRGDWRDEERARPHLDGATYDVAGGFLTLDFAMPIDGWNGAQELVFDVFRRSDVFGDNDEHALWSGSAPIASGSVSSIGVIVPESSATFTSLYSVRVRAVARNLAQEIVHSGPARVATLSMLSASMAAFALDPDCGLAISLPIDVPNQSVFNPTVVPTTRTSRFKKNEPPLPPSFGNL